MLPLLTVRSSSTCGTGVDLPVLGDSGPHEAVFAVTQAGIEATQFHDHVAPDQCGGNAIEDVGADEIVEMSRTDF